MEVVNLTKEQQEKLQAMYKNGHVQLIQTIAEFLVLQMRASRQRKSTVDETVWNLAESIGGENALHTLFITLYDLAYAKGPENLK